jgi:ABC-type uncharacterized transport system involved in gliding motility auxiliary subunit
MRLRTTLPAIIVAALALTLMPTSSAAAPKDATAASTTSSATPSKSDPSKAKPPAKSTSPSKKGAITSETTEGYAYDFSDDPLSGNSAAANAAVIRVRRAAARRTLIRPRLNFIPELFKSVENI